MNSRNLTAGSIGRLVAGSAVSSPKVKIPVSNGRGTSPVMSTTCRERAAPEPLGDSVDDTGAEAVSARIAHRRGTAAGATTEVGPGALQQVGGDDAVGIAVGDEHR